MSAFVVPNIHIDAILSFARLAARKLRRLPIDVIGPVSWDSPEHLTHIGRVLQAENIRSVNYRYASTDAGERPYTAFRVYPRPVSAMMALKACDCLNYQSCETPDWQQTEACALLKLIRNEALQQLIASHPLAQTADGRTWEITE